MIKALEIARRLIQCKSVTPQNDGAIEYLATLLETYGFTCRILDFAEPGYATIKNLYARYGKDEPNFCFAGHTDVVPIGNINSWKHDPFAAEVVDGILYGRGAVDMKGGIAAFAEAAIRFVSNNKFTGSISFLITGDEEAEAINGTPKLLQWLQQNNEKLSGCLVGEPTCPNHLGEIVQNGRRGSGNFELQVIGKQGHVAYAENFDNPATRLIKILHELKANPLDAGNKFFEPSNLEVTNLHIGNTATNVVPESATANFNIRFNDLQSRDSLVGKVDNICKHHAEDYRLKDVFPGVAFYVEPNRLSDIICASVEEMTNIKPKLSTFGGTSDARFIKDFCPVFEFGLIAKTAHQVDEHVKITELEQLTEIYYKIISRYFN